METSNTQPVQMKDLDDLIEARFPGTKVEIVVDDTYFEIELPASTVDKSGFVKAAYQVIKDYVEKYGDSEEAYQFSFQQGRELIDILHFNDRNAAYFIRMELFGKEQDLRVQDVLGSTGDYTIFNEDFQCLGYISAVGIPFNEGRVVNELEAEYPDWVHADFSNPAIWKASTESLEPYMETLLEKVSAEIHRNYELVRLNVDDPADLCFWAGQFEISEQDLREAVHASSNSIDDIKAYLQK